MNKEILSWFGNALNFVILIYLIFSTINTTCFSFSQSITAIFGFFVSILIQLRNILSREEEN